ncbi:DUF58 domain-containing protein [Pontiella sulfatireligans]|uniref:DUF58 domain-containing protein n=1 Tax=Pontiella sulfatireligans TaxID=2750658 RepID=A0A6C2UR01_9BACT|nr:DUF58 domain-containing protein [Pontiella sulfatireligans]VGO22373.1 hypothetical protein SCARR_04456 [Pontiella sulfatireligans]
MPTKSHTDLLKKVREIQIVSRKVVDELLGGEYKSVFKGRGMEFDEVREYMPGDEVRTIDWNVTARTGKPFVKRFIEEREQALFFLVDMSASGTFGSTEKTKNETAAELCGILAFSAIKNNDKVGLIIFTDEIELFIPPDKGQMHVLHMIRAILTFEPKRKDTSIACALDYLGKMVKKKCVTFLISDFQDSDYDKHLKLAAIHYDLIAITITDPRELKLPNAGLVELADAETGEQLLVDTASADARKKFNTAAKARHLEIKASLSRLNIDQIDVRTDRDYMRDLIRFFQSRDRRQVL